MKIVSFCKAQDWDCQLQKWRWFVWEVPCKCCNVFRTHQSWHPLMMEYRGWPGAVGAVPQHWLRGKSLQRWPLLWPQAVASWCRRHQAHPHGSGRWVAWRRASLSSFCPNLHFCRTRTVMIPESGKKQNCSAIYPTMGPVYTPEITLP